MTTLNVNLWSSPDHASEYLRRADSIPHRAEGEATLLELVPLGAEHILDLGSGAGRLLDLVKSARRNAKFVAVDFSSTMLEALRKQFGNDQSVSIVEHDLSGPLPQLGEFDVVVSSFAIHHLVHERNANSTVKCLICWFMVERSATSSTWPLQQRICTSSS